MRKKVIKKNLLIAILVCIIISIILFRSNLRNEQRKDITVAAEQYVTTGFFNNYKLLEIDSYRLAFSDTNNAILIVTGMESAAPHKRITLKLSMSKDKNNLWYVKKMSPYIGTDDNSEPN